MKVSGDKIRKIRQSQGLSTEALAAKIKPPVKRQAIESWELKGVGSFKTLNKIANALEVPPEFLLET